MAATQAPAAANKHQLRTEATKQKLLEASYRVFTRDGFEAARIEDIAAEAGFTRGAFYAHFASKGDLFIALLQRESKRGQKRFEQFLKGAKTAEERRAAFRNVYIAKASDRQWSILMLEFKLFALRHPDQHEALAQAHRALRDSFGQWLTETFGAELAGYDARKDFVPPVLGAVLSGMVLERAYDPKRLSDAQLRTMLGLIFDAVA